ncbi:hypothetical protein DND132_3025 [Pseudodesulfovibrio mercurii]|uniref:DUF748 domain-containing protein n=1 Tax=Pseudodesulfovibrio mercurii TaxID=641491 RepID=F0JJX9_9BACT|nr:DUF748 domain-containing protein [Pseudodesulfovibrio mercurii]EGB16228.1 hypothetical protein DND132_3025 [Pseudodesulfovibrio mercurii]
MLAFLDKIHFGTPLLRRIVFWLLTAFVVYTLFGFFAVPPILKSVLVSQIKENLKREASLGDIRFNPLNFHLEASDLHIKNLKEEGDLLSLGHLEVAPGASSIWKLAPVVSYLKLDGLNVNVTFYGNGKYSVSDLLGTPDSVNQEQPKPEEKGAIFPFALYGLELTNSMITFDDRPRGKKHVIADIHLRVPFTSSIAKDVKEFTQPVFTAVVNGDPVELKGRTLPFDKTLRTEFELGAVDVDLQQYWKYMPIKTPLELKSGRFTSDISLFFERPEAQRINLYLGGGGTLTDLELTAPGDGPVFSMKKLAFEMERFSLGDNALVVKRVSMSQPFFKVVRRADGEINWTGYFPGSEPGPTGPKVKTEADTNAAFVFDLRNFEIKDGTVDFSDQCVKGGFRHTFPKLDFTAEGLSTRPEQTTVFNGSFGSEGFIYVKGEATVTPPTTKLTLSGKDLDVPLYAPYLNEAQPLLVDSGKLGFSVDLDFSEPDGKPQVTAQNGTLNLANLAVRKPEAKEPSLTLGALDVTGATLDLDGRKVGVAEVKVSEPAVRVVREKDGRLDLQRIFEEAAKTGEEVAVETGTAPEPQGTADNGPETPWTATVDHVVVEDGSADFQDLALAQPTRLGLRRFKLDLTDISTEKGARMPYSVSAGWTGGGWFSARGRASIDPLESNGSIKVSKFGLRPLDGYLAQDTDLLIADGAVHADLDYTFTGGETPKFTAKGSTALSDLKVKTTFEDDELAGIDRLDVKGIDFVNEPMVLAVGEINLNGPRALVHFDKDGRLNVRRALRLPEPAPAPAEGAPQAEDKAGAAAAQPAPVPEAEVKEIEAQTEEQAAEEKPFFETLTVGKVGMQNGALKFRDESIHPSFATELTGMTLSLTDIGQTPEARPKVDFKAKIGPTPVAVTGVVNPVIRPIYSDLTISVNGMELVPLTPYTLKNLAYPIQKGRLYADVTFKTDNWVLDAKNKFFIEQLELGRKDKRPDAPNIPVEFGLALLQDSNGDMQLNLPITGRLDDPNFRIGGIVFQAIINMLFKALTSPFSLIGSMFGGGENMDFVVFEPGRAGLSAQGEDKLNTVIKALTERTKLKLEVDGVVDPVADRNGLVQVILEHKIRQAKYDDLPRSKRAETTVDQITVAPDEYEDMLYEAYAAEPDDEGVKPTTLFVTDRQPVDVMEKFIRDRIDVTDEMLHQLAMDRADAVKEYIITRDPALTDRVFLLDKETKSDGKTGVPKHRADLGID